MKIANWNVDHASENWRREALEAWMRRSPADIWVLTESRDSLTPGASYVPIAASTPGKRGDNDERWVTIWSRLPGARSLAPRDEEFAACATIAVPGGDRVTVYGSVLPWHGSVWRGIRSAEGAAFAAALDLHAADWRHLRSSAASTPLVVTGDFNQDLSGKHYYGSRLNRVALENALKSCGLRAKTRHPADPVRAATSGERACIDHICVTDGISDSSIVEVGAAMPMQDGRPLSDHPVVWIDVAI